MTIHPIMWNEIIHTHDLLCFEQKYEGLTVRIEARKTEREQWDIFRTYYDGDSLHYTEPYHVTTRDKAEALVHSLMDEKLLSADQIRKLHVDSQRRLSLKVKRVFKEYSVEKWYLYVNGVKQRNLVYVHDGESIELDFVLHEQFRFLESKIIKKLIRTLGYQSYECTSHVYYYHDSTHQRSQGSSKGMVIGRFEVGIEPCEE